MNACQDSENWNFLFSLLGDVFRIPLSKTLDNLLRSLFGSLEDLL